MTKLCCFAILLLTLASCQKEVEEPYPWECLPCGIYELTFDAVLSTGIGMDTTFTNLLGSLQITSNQNNEIQMTTDISSILGDTTGVYVHAYDSVNLTNFQIDANQTTLWGDAYTFSGVFNNTFDFISGTIEYYPNSQTTITFEGIKL